MSTEIIVSDDYIRATELHKCVKANLHTAAMSLIEVGRSLKELKERKLFHELGYQSFAGYCDTETHLGSSQSYKLIQIVDNLPEDFLQSTGNIGIEKLAILALATPEERETVQDAVDLDTVTVKKLKAELEAIRQENAALTEKAEQADIYAQQFDELSADKTKAEDLAERLTEENEILSRQMKELESRPVEHAVQEIPDPKQQEKIDELTARLQQNESEYTQRMQAAQRESADKLREVQQQSAAELTAVREAYEQQLAEAREAVKPDASPDTKGIFRAYLANAVDAMNRLMTFIEGAVGDENMPLFLAKVDSIMALTNERRGKL